MSSSLTTLDFETEGIEGNPLLFPPKPVGLAVRWPDGTKEYHTKWDAMVYTFIKATNGGPTLFHNAPFDLSVARHWFNITWPKWENIHDTMFLVYLADPYAKTFALKPSAERYLGIPPDEQDACKAWVMHNVRGATEKHWGKYLCLVPEPILAPYAKQDVEDTFLLFQHLYPETPQEPYDRERELMPILADSTIRGVRVATKPLNDALELYTGAFEQADDRLRTVLCAPSLNPSSGVELARALDEAGMVTEWVLTPTGKRSTAMKNLRVDHQPTKELLQYRSTLKTLLGTFIKGWLEQESNGRLHPNWNSTRGVDDGGTRTGRLSSDHPNFQNIPNVADIASVPGLPDLPHMRNFILPEEGHVWIKRDFSAQEIRIAAHFEDGALAEAFRQDPHLDPHDMVRLEVLALTAVNYIRKYIKETGFGILYGMGRATLADRLGTTYEVADALILAYLRVLPGIKGLQRGTKWRGQTNQPVRTWGGRLIHKEPHASRDLSYKLLNYLIQGSAADQTKQCIIEWDRGRPVNDIFMATVHDEINISAPIGDEERAMKWLKIAMDDTGDFDVPMRSEGFIGPTWGEVGDE